MLFACAVAVLLALAVPTAAQVTPFTDPAAFLYTVDDLLITRASVLEIPTLGLPELLLLASLLAGLGFLVLRGGGTVS